MKDGRIGSTRLSRGKRSDVKNKYKAVLESDFLLRTSAIIACSVLRIRRTIKSLLFYCLHSLRESTIMVSSTHIYSTFWGTTAALGSTQVRPGIDFIRPDRSQGSITMSLTFKYS